jgi:hypothetical protein
MHRDAGRPTTLRHEASGRWLIVHLEIDRAGPLEARLDARTFDRCYIDA